MEREVKENNKALENTEGNLEDATKNADKFAEKIDDVGDESADTKGKLSKLGVLETQRRYFRLFRSVE